MLLADAPPLTPDEPTGREWLLEELAKTEYQQARPNPIEVWFRDAWEWFLSLFQAPEGSPFAVNPLVIVVALLVIAAIAALIFFGRPRAVAARRASPGSVFLDDDARTAHELRAAAKAAADAGDWSLAITEQFRAIARSLGDRTVIAVLPGTTAQAVARAAAAAFPDERAALADAADSFDAVRYLDRAGDADRFGRIRDLDARLERTRPANHDHLEAVR